MGLSCALIEDDKGASFNLSSASLTDVERAFPGQRVITFVGKDEKVHGVCMYTEGKAPSEASMKRMQLASEDGSVKVSPENTDVSVVAAEEKEVG